MNQPWRPFYPESVPYEPEIPSLSLYELLRNSAELYPERTAVIDDGQELTYRELKHASDRLAASLYRSGLRKGDRIGLMLPNCSEYIISFYAVHRLGAIVVQINPAYEETELQEILEDSGAGWLIIQSVQQSKLDRADLDNQLNVLYTDRNRKGEDSLYRWIETGTGELPEVDIHPESDLAVLQYTGGTTGKAKGVMLTHSNITANVYQDHLYTAGPLQLQEAGERLLGLSPLFHVFGMARLNSAIYTAATYITINKFKIHKVADMIREYRPTIFPGVPTMYISLLNHPDLEAEDLSCFKYCSCGSAPLPAEVIHQFRKKYGVTIYEGFGMSETGPTTHRNPINGQNKVGSIGVPYPATDAKVMDIETGTTEMPPGQAGELIIKGPQVMKGYWNNHEETSLALRDGWFYTGDIAMMDEEGYFFIVGRKKEMIIASGYNVYPVEVENVIYHHPGVEEAAVFGIPDPYSGESVTAAIVPKRGIQLTEKEMISWCTGKMAKYKIPRSIGFRNRLPKSAVGKILKRVLAEEESRKREETKIF